MNPAQTEDNRPTDYKFSKSELFKYTLLDAPYAVSCLTNEIGDLFIFYIMDNDMVRLRKRKNYKVRKSNACVKAAIYLLIKDIEQNVYVCSKACVRY